MAITLRIILIIYALCPIIMRGTIISSEAGKVYGPGLRPHLIVHPARYFFIEAFTPDGQRWNSTPPTKYEITLRGKSPKYDSCRYRLDQIDRGDGTTIVRYKTFDTCEKVEIIVKYNGAHVGDSPFIIPGYVYSEDCDCPMSSMDEWLSKNECSLVEEQIDRDLSPFRNISFAAIRSKLIQRFDSPGSISLCNYVIKNNQVYRKCYGKHVGFNMFMDAILLSLTRKMRLPDLEMFVNLGDWPLMKKGRYSDTSGPFPIFSWCGNENSFDIVMPTYDITESTIQNMGQVMLDMLSVQRSKYPWKKKKEKAFWRGRDARRERLTLIDIARKYPTLFNASLTNFFFFTAEESVYGPKVPHTSFMDFFQYKYQINIDGTVAAYRFPYLLGGDSTVLKQDSPYYEHFYSKVKPYEHYVPFKRDLSDLKEKVEWLKANDNEAKRIATNGRIFANNNLLPSNIFCYYALLLREWSQRLSDKVKVLPGMDLVKSKGTGCECFRSKRSGSVKGEL